MAANALYLHLRNDGGIFVVRGTGQEELITEDRLREEIATLIKTEGVLLYTRDAADRDPPPDVVRLFQLILSLRSPGIRLLEEPNPNAQLTGGATSLMQAAYLGAVDVVQDLLRRGAPVEASDSSGYTALMYAAQRGRATAAAALLDHAADPDASDNEGNRPLMFAAQGGYEAVVDLLLRHGADKTARGTSGFTAQAFAVQNGHTRLVGRLAC